MIKRSQIVVVLAASVAMSTGIGFAAAQLSNPAAGEAGSGPAARTSGAEVQQLKTMVKLQRKTVRQLRRSFAVEQAQGEALALLLPAVQAVRAATERAGDINGDGFADLITGTSTSNDLLEQILQELKRRSEPVM